MTRKLLLTSLLALGAATVATSAGAQQSRDWNWSGTLGAGRTIYLRNINGDVRFEAGTGNKVEVRAEKRWRRGNPDEVRIEARQSGSGDGDVIICAFWNERATCDENGYHGNNDRDRRWRDDDDNGNVSVHFVVKIPANARVDASTVNGEMIVEGTSADIDASTVNGNIEAHSASGRVEANTVNGSITVRTNNANVDGLEYSTVNGSITIELPANVNANISMTTVNGNLSSDFPLTLDGTINPRRIRAKLGNGGPTIRATTVNGSVRLRKQ